MCNNIIVLWIFYIIKILIYMIVPIILFFVRKKKIYKVLLYIEIIVLIIFLGFNFTGKNACMNNSSIRMINEIKNYNKLNQFQSIYDESKNIYTSLKPNKNFKTYTGRDLYYFNQNRDYMKNSYYECNNKKIYMSSSGSSIVAFSSVISTLYQKTISPIDMFENYKNEYSNICNSEITIENIYNSVMKKYGGISLTQISKSQIESSIRNDGIVIAKVEANENSKITCDSGYILIYSIGLDGNFLIADPALTDKSFVCPASSDAYGNIIDKDNMNKSWTLNEIDNEAVIYYLVRKV